MTIPSTTDDLIAEIEAAANAATPGDWKAKGTLFGEWSISTDYTTEGKRLENGRQLIAFSPAASKTNAPVYAAMFEANAKHMALCNPANVLALTAELRQREQSIAEQAKQLEYAADLLAISQREKQGLEKDAERYAWMKENVKYEFFGDQIVDLFTKSGAKIDTLIDTAILAERQK
jgi:hypothetical protein